MLRHRRSILAQLLYSPSTSTISPPHRPVSASAEVHIRGLILTYRLSSPVSPPRRLLSAAAPPRTSPTPSSFAVEDYLVHTCGLTRPQALKASAKLSHLKSPAKPDAVLAYLAGRGFSSSDVAALVAGDPSSLCAGVERTLAPTVTALTGLGLSRSEIARLASLAGHNFRDKSVLPKLQYYLDLFGSSERLFWALHYSCLLSSSLERVVKPNVALLRECGLGACDIAKKYGTVHRLLTINPESLRAMVARAEGLGVPRGSGMFKHALRAVAFQSEEKIAARVNHLKETFRWSDAEVGIALSKSSGVLTRSKESLQRRCEFLFSEVGLEPAYIAYRPVILSYSLEGRLRPRYYVLKFLKENGFLKRDLDYNSALLVSDKLFVDNYICPHKEAAVRLTEDYVAACRGEKPASFRFT